jgi:hypothetical protein
MAQFPTFGNATGVWNINDVYNNVSGGTWPNNGSVGMLVGGKNDGGGELGFYSLSINNFSSDVSLKVAFRKKLKEIQELCKKEKITVSKFIKRSI